MARVRKKQSVSAKETYRQGLLLGMGLASLSKKAAVRYINKVVAENKLSTRDGEKLATSLAKKTSAVSRQITNRVQSELKTRLSTGLKLSRQGLQTLNRTLSAIEKQLATPQKKKKR